MIVPQQHIAFRPSMDVAVFLLELMREQELQKRAAARRRRSGVETLDPLIKRRFRTCPAWAMKNGLYTPRDRGLLSNSPLLKSLFYRPGSTVTATTRMANPSGEAATRMIATAGPVSTNKR